MSTTSHTPKDAKIMAAILKDCGINEYEPRVMNQMLEFAYRYISDLLDDAKVYSDYAGKKQIDADDVKLAVQLKVDSMFTNPPPKELLLEIAKEKNSLPLPPLKQQSGLKLPPDRYCLTQPNYRLKADAHHTVVAPSDSNKPAGRFQATRGLSVKKEPSPGLSFKKEPVDGTSMHAVQSAPSFSQATGLSGVQPVRPSGSTTSADQPPASTTTGAAPFAPAKPLFRLVSGNETGGSVGSSSGLKRKFEQLDEDYDKI